MRRSTVPLALLAAISCSRSPDSGPPASTPPPGTAQTATETSAAQPGVLFPTGVMLKGDRASLQHYLRYVDTVTGAKVAITYAPLTVVITRNAAIRSLLSASWDGVTWRFDAEEPAVRRIQVGSVVLVWGLAIRKVTQVEQVGDEIVLTTTEAQLTDAVTDAKISWDAPGHLLQGAMAMRVPKPVDSVRFLSASVGAPRSTLSPFRLVSTAHASTAAQDDSAAKEPPTLYSESFKLKVLDYSVAMAFGAASEDGLNFYAQFAHGDEAEEPVGLPGEFDEAFKYGGKFEEWVRKQQEKRDKEAAEGKKKLGQIRDETKITSGTGPGLKSPIPKNSEEQQRQKEEEDAEAQYQKKYGKPTQYSTDTKTNLPDMPKPPTTKKEAKAMAIAATKSAAWGLVGMTAIKVTASGTVTGFRSKGDISITGGKLDHATLETPDFHLVGDIFWAIRIDVAVFAAHKHLEIPVTFRVPLILGGVPGFLEIAVNAQIQPALTGKTSTAKGHRHIDFSKSGGFVVTPGDVSGEAGDPNAAADQDPEEKMMGLGVSGLMIALQVPRIGLAFGIIGSNIMGYYDVVVASGATFTGMTGLIKCTHSQLVANLNVGVSATFLGFPLGDKRKAGPKKEWSWDDPPGRKCG